MQSDRNICAGLWVQTFVVVGTALLWHVSWILGLNAGKGSVSELNLFWSLVFASGPLISPLVTGAFAFAGSPQRKERPLIYGLTILVGLSPLVFVLALLPLCF